ncbi:DNA polymerase III subunit beta [Candidatus Saccharibacteria bacterium]|nr:DNA polymerase III subunit beta [Candidatus Saccharibacteria bacterium]
MEIEVESGKLAKALAIVSRIAVNGKAILPILNNVLIRVDARKVSLTTTNLDMAVVDFLPVSESKDGVVTVPARLLAEFVGNLPKGAPVKIIADGTKVVTESGKYTSTLNGTVADDFPELPEIDEVKMVRFKMGVDEFKTGMNQVMMACSNDMTRPALTGVYFNTDDGTLYIAATDGYRLAERRFIEKVESEVKAIVPASSLSEVMRSLSDEEEEIEILFDEAQVRFRFGEIEITSKLIDGSFPDYRQLIPKTNEAEIVLEKGELLRVTKLAALFAREVGGSIVLEAKTATKTFSVASVANEFGENTSEIETTIPKDERMTLNSRFLIDALNAVDEEKVVLGFSGKLNPIVVKNEKSNNYTHIIMPLKS